MLFKLQWHIEKRIFKLDLGSEFSSISPLFFFFLVFFHDHARFKGQQGKVEGIYLTPLYHFVFPKYCTAYRSSHRRYSKNKGIPKNFAKFTGKHLRQSLF